MKLVLDIDSLNDDFFEDTRMLGIAAPVKNYRFCWLLNNQAGFNFRLNNDLEIHLRKKNREYFFSVYQSHEPNSFLNHYIYHNKCDGEFLLPEFKHMDFLWLMKGDVVDDTKCTSIRESIKQIASVQLVAELTNEHIKNKGNMVF